MIVRHTTLVGLRMLRIDQFGKTDLPCTLQELAPVNITIIITAGCAWLLWRTEREGEKEKLTGMAGRAWAG